VKRPNLLIQIWPEIRKVCPNALLLLLGSGPLEEELKQAAPEGVQFCGSQADVAPYLQAADLFVLPSASEGLPVSMLESMACELPCVVTRVGGNPDVIEHGANGWLIPPDDVEALQTALQTLMLDPALRERLGAMARKRVMEGYTIENTANRLAALYQKIVADGARS
jgi:glycosyltransferase involved in cell wall biosynthesis